MLLITGSNGQLGTCLKAILPNAICADVVTLDITDCVAVAKFVAENRVETIVNCAAYTAVDRAEDDAERAHKINVLGCENLAKSGAKVIQISTDYVFDGAAGIPYTETDAPNPLSVYAHTKYESEKVLFANAKTAAVVRTAWLYSNIGNNFAKTIRKLGGERKSIGVVFDQIGTPTYAPDLALAIKRIAESLEDGSREIYHFSNEGVCSWYDFAQAIIKLSDLPCEVLPIESKDFPQRAKRPPFSVLNKSKFKRAFGVKIRHWQEALEKCISQF